LPLLLLPRGEVARTTLTTPTGWSYWLNFVNGQADRQGISGFNCSTLVCVSNLEATLLLYQLLALVDSTLLCISYRLPIVNFGETGILLILFILTLGSCSAGKMCR